MKSFRWTYVFGLAVLALIVFTLYDYKRSQGEDEKREQDLRLLRVDPEDATRVEIVTRTGSSLVLEKRDGRWHLTVPIQDEADPMAVENFLSDLDDEKVIETIPLDSGTTPKTFGLDDPPTILKVQAADGQSQELKIGSVKAYDSNLYAQQGTEPHVLLVSQSWDRHLTKRADELRDKGLVRAEWKSSEIKRLEIRTDKRGRSHLVFVKDGEEWKMTQGGDGFPIRQSAVEDYIEHLRTLKANRIHGDKDGKGALAPFRLDAPALAVKLFTDANEEGKPLFEARFSDAQSRSDGSPAELAAVSSDRKEILSVLSTAADPVFKSAQSFYDKSRPFQFPVADVARMKVDSGEVKAEFVKKDGAWESERVAETIEMLSRMEAVRILAHGSGKKRLEGESSIVLSKADGEKVFEFRWGKSTVDKNDESGLEVQYHPALTSTVDRQIRVTERNVEALGLSALKSPDEATGR